jgi:hypothetical protein
VWAREEEAVVEEAMLWPEEIRRRFRESWIGEEAQW